MMKRGTIFLFFFSHTLISFSQGFGVGYTIGRFVDPLRNMEIMTYEFNQDHPNYTDLYHFNNLYRGLVFTFFKESDNGGFEMMFTNKHIKADAEGADAPSDTIFKHQVKVRQNVMSFGAYKSFGSILRAGVDFDLGACKFYKRVGPKDNFSSSEWTRIFDNAGFIVFGFTPFVELSFGPIRVRPYYQWSMIEGETHYGLLKDYAFKTSTYGVMAYFAIGKKD
jgi:hypothetical protein